MGLFRGGGGTSYVLVVSFMDVNFGFRCHLGSAQQEMPMFSPIKISWDRSEMKSPPFFRSSPLTRNLKQARLYRVGLFIDWASPAGFDKYCLTPWFQWFSFFYFAIKCKTQGRKTIHEAANKKKSFDGCATFLTAVRESSKKTSVTRTVVWQALLFR